MAEQDVHDGADTITRIGKACDTLGGLGYPEVAGAIARSTRQRRGLLRRKVYPAGIARELLDLAEQTEHLARTLGTPLGLDIGHDTCPACGGKPRRCTARDECCSGYCGWDPVSGDPHTCPAMEGSMEPPARKLAHNGYPDARRARG